MVEDKEVSTTVVGPITVGFIVGAVLVPDAGGATYQLLVMVEGDNGASHFYRVYAMNGTTGGFSLAATITAAASTINAKSMNP